MKQKSNINLPGKPYLSMPDYGIWIESHHHRPGFSTEEHTHEQDSIIYVVSGRGKCIIADCQYLLAPDCAIFLPKKMAHRFIDRPGNAMVVFVLHFSSQLADVNKEVIDPIKNINGPVLVPAQYAELIRKRLRQMLHEQNTCPPKFAFALKQALSSILLQLYRVSLIHRDISDRKHNDSSFRVRVVLDYIKNNYYQSVSLSEAARKAHLSQRQFSNLCKQLTGTNFVNYVNTIRVEKARELITETELSVSAIAFEVGYEESSTFYRAFKKHFDTSPLTLRD